MKTAIFSIGLGLLLSSSIVSAASVPAQCFNKAASAVEKQYAENYDKDGFEAYDCNKSTDNRAVVCDVAASKGDGAALDTYQVVMNKTCSKVFSVKLTGEE